MKKISFHIFLYLIIIAATACTPEKQKSESVEISKSDYLSFYQSDLFKAVQLEELFEDSKTFVDCIPRNNFELILMEYKEKKEDEDFNLKQFVKENFELPAQFKNSFSTADSTDMFSHINRLWPYLTRKPDTATNSSLIPLPNEYIVPGGRFREIYYWDSYFTILGLKAAGKDELAFSMLDNFSFLIDSLGFIPNGNRMYYLGRSQPPFFALMVDELCSDNRSKFTSYHGQMIKEYNFWMSGADKLTEKSSVNQRSVLLDEDVVLNRYFDTYNTPRPESFKEDYMLVKEYGLDPDQAYVDLRAGAESGWDYSSRWLGNKRDLQTIQTTAIIPVDLNVLLYILEIKIAQSYNWQDQLDSAEVFLNKAEKRKSAINSILWNEKQKNYCDYNFIEEQHTDVVSMASAYPLFAGIAPKDKARYAIKQIQDSLLYDGGLVTSTIETGQQWDYPNAWAPLQWIGMKAFINYQRNDLAYDLVDRWLRLNEKVFRNTGKMMEKYNVVDTSLQAGGGEYALQDGFGWTNGVALAMKGVLEEKPKKAIELDN